ncbi:hypothetical protein K493DRAFT_309559 [Basidiobolus meristosporus CBS 931.73]|uniref:Uncharacterized protein n=1 Tax=Basidiobolus meristosporus CBS 931.73 TaxID=1314790 RepID=A0A1Y1VT14_9FUNG|nr:hypothetical protein K493DRAFT_309559 [Basidiobolus meristosporus CBS 931.73]|eukprot:ORX64440.1 hypothetical protein K493DRAFT_309559 [Basidiobolus meristosporus CBS 931.73]
MSRYQATVLMKLYSALLHVYTPITLQKDMVSCHASNMKYSIAKLLLVISTALTINAIVLERSYDPDYKGMGHGGGDYDDDYDSNGHGRRKKYGDDYDGNGRGRRRYDGDDYDGHGHGRKKHGNDYDGRKKYGGSGRGDGYDDYQQF